MGKVQVHPILTKTVDFLFSSLNMTETFTDMGTLTRFGTSLPFLVSMQPLHKHLVVTKSSGILKIENRE